MDQASPGTQASAGTDDERVENDSAGHRFEIRFPESVAFLKYHYDSVGRLHLDHTEVPPTRQHHGVAALLARGALDFARDQGLKVVPACPYVVAYLKEHPEFDSILEDVGARTPGIISD
jgi:predicted GNAT family acetyltransferase